MKRNFWLVLGLISVMAYACGDNKVRDEIIVSPGSLTFANTNEVKTIQVNAGEDISWITICDGEWCVLSSSSGKGNGKFDVSIDGNKLAVGKNTSKISVLSEDVPGKEFVVNAEFITAKVVYTLRPDTDKLTFESTGETKTVSVSTGSHINWTAVSDVEWCVITNGSGTGDGKFTIELDIEKLNDQKTARIILTSDQIADQKFVINVESNLSFVFDDFENHEDFTINSPGKAGWSYIDGDESATFGFQGVVFPGMRQPMAFIIFNPSETFPPANHEAHSGKKSLACFGAGEKPNNDWLISPPLNYKEAFKIAFWAKEQTSDSGHERFRVVYSTAGNTMEDFSHIVSKGDYEETSTTWTRYEYDIPAEATYVAINCISDNAFIFFIDDIIIDKGKLPNKTKKANMAHSPAITEKTLKDTKQK